MSLQCFQALGCFVCLCAQPCVAEQRAGLSRTAVEATGKRWRSRRGGDAAPPPETSPAPSLRGTDRRHAPCRPRGRVLRVVHAAAGRWSLPPAARRCVSARRHAGGGAGRQPPGLAAPAAARDAGRPSSPTRWCPAASAATRTACARLPLTPSRSRFRRCHPVALFCLSFFFSCACVLSSLVTR